MDTNRILSRLRAADADRERVASLIVRWAVSEAPFFFPAIPMFWLAISLLVHSRLLDARSKRTAAVS